MIEIRYDLWKEGKYYISQSLNVNITSFGESVNEVYANHKEAVELYYEENDIVMPIVENATLKRDIINAFVFSSKEMRSVVEFLGFQFLKQKGQHAKFRNPKGDIVILPLNKIELPEGSFKNILKQCGITLKQFKALLNSQF
ncbi:MAG: hypothetical protein HW421_436 [Ignavibacteria bacterium]|nr:hypothetical protein [Ignavibacteria bacterium]